MVKKHTMKALEELVKDQCVQGRSTSATDNSRPQILHDGSDYYAQLHELRISSRYQPIVSIPHRRVVGHEALLDARLIDSSITPVAAFSYINEQELSQLELDRLSRHIHLLNYTAKSADDWLFLNISSEAISHYVEQEAGLESIVPTGLMPPESLVFEILEDTQQDIAQLQQFVRYCKEQKVLVAVDDFGAGHSNFDRIWSLAPDIVKLDSSNIWKAEQDPMVRRLLPRMISLLREAGSVVLIEGIENETQAKIAMDTEADLLQGYYFLRPQSNLAVTEANGVIEELTAAEVAFNGQPVDMGRDRLRSEFARAVGHLMTGKKLAEAFSRFNVEQVRRCYVLNRQGVEIESHRLTGGEPECRFSAMKCSGGASWARRPYFIGAMANPGHIFTSPRYMSLPDGHVTETLSIATQLEGTSCVICLDLN
ncbi:EAL domain-containing protein (putative c-di-GMP-specific phosphodiesterase class I) [Sinobacterium caligoides]|uniref:EAL domain-containing protein (Putative c-di-GMP-specific phosphodiesterase class I) n=1 Tax=Sinobacterium caligoides TaxID=933926 RepID=A0A3N2DPW3_9GAMM|nr:EAL domain-containing protein [Sinobacterium caligoides]ROS01874.1 EAL domain-containing protein (putative c-di-GMP-specific phosphodiesterase class I) [Sinobacterium caligoides]